MRRKPAMLLAGAVTAFVLVIAVGLMWAAGSHADALAQASTPDAATATAAATASNTAGNASQIATLQAEVKAYQQQLTQANTALQQAYDQLRSLQQTAAVVGAQTSPADQTGQGGQFVQPNQNDTPFRRFRSGGDDDGPRFGQQNPGGIPFFGQGSDD